jgi:hypothetical protein
VGILLFAGDMIRPGGGNLYDDIFRVIKKDYSGNDNLVGEKV